MTATTTSPLRLTLNGACGRMGREVVERLREEDTHAVASLWESPRNPSLAIDVYGIGVPVSGQWETPAGDVIIDFTNETGLNRLMDGWGDCPAALVSGSTGVSDTTMKRLRELSTRVPVFYAANMSTGVYVLKQLARRAAELLGGAWDVELVEMHHNRKADAPSGTASALVKVLQECWPTPLKPVYGRSGIPGPRKAAEMGVFALRGGDVIGEHQVILAGQAETLKLQHTAVSRAVFAVGAVRAASFVAGRGPGFYTMDDLFTRL